MYQEPFMDEEEDDEPAENSMGLASMVAGIVSLLTACCAFSGFFFGGLAVLFAALSRTDDWLNRQGTIGLFTGLGGILLGSLSLLWWLHLII